MAEDYKTTASWQALNRIWKVLPPALRESVKDDFRLLTDVVKEQIQPKAASAPQDAPPKEDSAFDFENKYLEGMSRETVIFALKCLTQSHTDIYKSIMECIISNKIRDMDTLWAKYERDDLCAGNEAAVREIMCICLERARLKNNI